MSLTVRNKNCNYRCSMNLNLIVLDYPFNYLNVSKFVLSAIEKSNPTCNLKFATVRINSSNLYGEKFYDRSSLF